MSKAERVWVSPFYPDQQRVTKAMLPNLVLMVADDLAYEDLGSYGATGAVTPHADRLAQSGVHFAAAHTPSPLCTPSRYSLLTGQYSSCYMAQNEATRGRLTRQISLDGKTAESPELASIEFNINLCAEGGGAAGRRRRRRAEEEESAAQQSSVTMAQLLKQRGYATGFVGKWHLGYPHSNLTAELRKRVVGSPASAWRGVKEEVLREHRSGGEGRSALPDDRAPSASVDHLKAQGAPTRAPERRLSSVEACRGLSSSACPQDDGHSRTTARYRSVQAHVRRGGFDFAERVYVNNLYPEQHLLPSEMLHHNTEWGAP